MVFLLILPSAIFGLVAMLITIVDIRIEITERRRRARPALRRRMFRPVVIQGGKGKIAAIEPPQAAPDDEHPEPLPIKLIRAAPP